MGEYTETSKLIPSGNTHRRNVYLREILFYTVISASVIAFLIVLLSYFISEDYVSGKQMRSVDLEEARGSSKLASWKVQQLKALLMGFTLEGSCIPVPSNNPIPHYDDLPDAVDWRKKGVIGAVINQLSCNICWQVSIVQVMETMVAIRRKVNYVTTLSIQELVDCSHQATCYRGDPHQGLKYMTDENMSIVTEEQYPLTLRAEECQYKHTLYPKGVKIKDFRVGCKVNETYVMGLLSRHGPVIASVDASLWKYYSDGIISQHCNSASPQHVVQIVGYDRTGKIPYYIVKNSWGEDFGDNGYLYVKMGGNLCGIEDYITSLDVEF